MTYWRGNHVTIDAFVLKNTEFINGHRNPNSISATHSIVDSKSYF